MEGKCYKFKDKQVQEVVTHLDLALNIMGQEDMKYHTQ